MLLLRFYKVNNPNLGIAANNCMCEVSGGSGSQGYILTLQVQQGTCTLSKTRSGVYADCPPGGPQFVSVYPNPSSDELVVSFQYDSLSLSTNAVMTNYIQVDLINAELETVYSEKTKNNSVTIPVNKLPNGLYYLHVINREGVIRKQIVVER